MPVVWNLKKWLALERDIYRPVELQTLIRKQTGVDLTIQTISNLINGTPSALRLQTIQVLCNALDCNLSDFCNVLPDTAKTQHRERKVAGDKPRRLYGSKSRPRSQSQDPESMFPDPLDYTDIKKDKSDTG
jgi:DNA-binding Xre family transcriptional regulator